MKDAGCRGQHLSTDDLLTEVDNDLEKQVQTPFSGLNMMESFILLHRRVGF